MDGRVVTRYLGIVEVPDRVDVVEMGGESDDDNSSEQESVHRRMQQWP